MNAMRFVLCKLTDCQQLLCSKNYFYCPVGQASRVDPLASREALLRGVGRSKFGRRATLLSSGEIEIETKSEEDGG